ncbi:MAG: Arginine-tRNA ligase [Parcubacteria group bacterium Gr01-1014_73]|nr:MAG: Arginine-tRNA ligase [Parcubacteria group bacterium Gr01-1014_73]
MIKEKLDGLIKQTLKSLGIEAKEILLEHPADLAHGDYSTNVALVYAKETKMKPKELAESIRFALLKELAQDEIGISKIEVAGAGFINFYLSPKFFADSIAEILAFGENFGKNESRKDEKVMVEYTDPNTFKVFHIGHLMSNAIGESIARLFEFSGAKVIRTCYPSDVGLHIAKAVWGVFQDKENYPSAGTSLSAKTNFLGRAYVAGTKAYEGGESTKKEIDEINQKLFEKSDLELNKIYDEGRKWSLDHFEELYKKLGTKFDYYFFEGREGRDGEKIVSEFLKKGVFEKSDGAVVFRGEKYGLHTRVFITSQGLPTYEIKELGLN